MNLSWLLGWRGYVITGAVSGALAFWGGWAARDVFADLREAKTENTALKADRDELIADLRGMLRADEISADLGGKSAERQVQIRTVTRDIIREVPVYVTAKADAGCVVTTGAVRLHDAAATGTPPTLPDATGAPNDAASAVDLSALVATAAENYGTCRADQGRLADLQAWIRAQAAAWPP